MPDIFQLLGSPGVHVPTPEEEGSTFQHGMYGLANSLTAMVSGFARRTGLTDVQLRMDELSRQAVAAQQSEWETLSPTTQRDVLAPIGSDRFWSNLSRVGATQFSEAVPSLLGGVAATGVGTLLGGPVGGAIGAATYGGLTTGGEVEATVQNIWNATPDEDRLKIPRVQELIEQGKSLDEASNQYLDESIKDRSLVAGILGAALGVINPAHIGTSFLLSGAAGRAGIKSLLTPILPKSRLAAMGVAGISDLAGEGLEGAIPPITTNLISQAAPEMGIPEQSVVQGAAQEALAGFIPGVFGGAVVGGHGGGAGTKSVKPTSGVTTVPAGVPNPAQQAALTAAKGPAAAAAPPPPPNLATGAPAVAPQPPTAAAPGGAAPASVTPAAAGGAAPTGNIPPAGAVPAPIAGAIPETTTPSAPISPMEQDVENAKQAVWAGVPPTATQLAARLGVSRGRASMAIAKMQQAGILSAQPNYRGGGAYDVLLGPDMQPVPPPVAAVTPEVTTPAPAVEAATPEAPAPPAPPAAPSAPAQLGPEQVMQGLRDLGYGNEQISTMRLADARNIVVNQIPPGPTTAPVEETAIPETAAPAPVEAPQEPQGAPLAASEEVSATTPTPESALTPTPIMEPSVPTPAQAAETFAPEEAPRAPRILEAAASPEAQAVIDIGVARENAAQAARDKAAKTAANEEARKAKAIAAGFSPRKDVSKAKLTKMTQTDPAKAETIFNETAEIPVNYGNIKQFKQYLRNVVARANAAKIETPTNVTEGTSDHMMWLTNAKKALADKTDLLKFAGSEVAARKGDFGPMRSEHGAVSVGVGRAAGGETVERMAGTAQAATEEEAAANEQAAIAEEEAAGGETALAEAPAEEAAPAETTTEGEQPAEGEAETETTGKDERGALVTAAVEEEEVTAGGGTKYAKGEPVIEAGKVEYVKKGDEVIKTIKKAEPGKKVEMTAEAKAAALAAMEKYSQTSKAKEDAAEAKARGKTVAEAPTPKEKVATIKAEAKEKAKAPTSEVITPAERRSAINRVFADLGSGNPEKILSQFSPIFQDDARAIMKNAADPTEGYAQLVALWEKSHPGKVVGPTPSMTEAIDASMQDKNSWAARRDQQDIELAHQEGAIELNGHWVKPVRTMTMTEAMHAFPSTEANKTSLYGATINRIANAVSRLVPFYQVYVLSRDDLNIIGGNEFNPLQAGVHSLKAGPDGPFIAVSQELAARDPQRLRQTLIHEGIHAVTAYTLRNSVYLNNLMEQVLDYIKKDTNLDGATRRGLVNVRELLAELANPEFMDLLSQVSIPRELGAKLGLAGWRKSTAYNVIVDFIRKLFGLAPNEFKAVEAVLSTFERITNVNDEISSFEYSGKAEKAVGTLTGAQARDFLNAESNITGAVRITNMLQATDQQDASIFDMGMARQVTEDLTQRLVTSKVTIPSWTKWALMKVKDNADIMRTYEHLFKPRMLRIATNAVAERGTIVQELMKEDAVIINEENRLYNKYEGKKIGSKSIKEHYEDLTHDESNFRVDASIPLANNTWLGKDKLVAVTSKAQYPRLRAEYEALAKAAPDLAAHRTKMFNYYRDKHVDELETSLMMHVIDAAAALGNKLTPNAALALGRRVVGGNATASDKKAIGDEAFKRLDGAPIFKVREGPFRPQMRFGNYVVNADLDIAPPTLGTFEAKPNLGGATYEFKGVGARTFAKRYAAKEASGKPRDGIYATVESIWTDAKGDEYYTVPSGEIFKYGPKDLQAENRFRVAIQDQHTQFVESQHEAIMLTDELRKDKAYKEVNYTAREKEAPPRVAGASSRELQAIADSLSKRSALSNLPPKIAAEVQAAIQQSVYRAAPGGSINKRKLQRKNVMGASRDSIRTMHNYSVQANNFIAMGRTAHKIDAAFAALKEDAARDMTKSDAENVTKQDVINELEHRYLSQSGMHIHRSPFINALTSWQFIDKLASVSYTLVNMAQVAMTTIPELAAKHGVFNAVRMVNQAYRDLGFFDVIKGASKDTWDAFVGRLESSKDYVDFASKSGKFSKEEVAMLNELVSRSSIGSEAGLEAVQIGVTGKPTKVLNYVEAVGRQFPQAVEAMNRIVAATAAYRLAKKKGMNVEQATDYAQDIVDKTQFNYTPTNAAPVFNSNIGRVALQFKKFGVAWYSLYFGHVMKMLRGPNKAENAKAVLYFTAAQVAVAGLAGGLPTEPLRAVVTFLNSIGVVDWNWQNVEGAAADLFADMVGPTWGEAATKGLPRLINMEMSQRLGQANLLLSQPIGDMQDREKFTNYLYQLVGGPTGTNVVDIFDGVNEILDGDIGKGAEKVLPIKAFTDIMAAYRIGTEGTTTGIGDVIRTPNLYEAGLRGLGITSGSTARAQEFRARAYNVTTQRNKSQLDAKRAFFEASPADRPKMRQDLKDAGVTLGEAYQYVKERNSRVRTSNRAVPTTKPNAALLRELEKTYPRD